MKQQEFKGEITAFLSLVFILLISFVGSMIQSASIQITRSIKRADTELALESVFAEYNKEMLEEYGVFVKLDGDETKLSRRLWFYGAKNMEHQIKRMQLLTDNNGEAFYEQAVKFMGGDVAQIPQISRETVETEAENNARQLTEVLQKEEQELPKENNPIENVNQLKKSSLLSLILSDSEEVSSRYIVLEELPSHRNLKSGKGDFEILQEIGFTQKALFSTYLTERFSNFTQSNQQNALFYETEYLLAGFESDQENLEAVAKRILSVRMALNYAYLLSDHGKQAEAEAMALTIGSVLGIPGTNILIKQAILFSWAYGEGVLDLRILFAGKRVPFVKNSENWQLKLENLVKLGTTEEVKEEKESIEGLNYNDYIKALLVLENKDTLSMRALDLIELNLGIRVDGCVTALEIKSTLEMQLGIKDTFLTNYQYK